LSSSGLRIVRLPDRLPARDPQATSLYQLLDTHFETLKGRWSKDLERLRAASSFDPISLEIFAIDGEHPPRRDPVL